ncbi:MAG: hypothetical protein QOI66_3903, partial [Myxococcales bacterium]|nr:hypothetical protein [Myxococcales bacterium]
MAALLYLVPIAVVLLAGSRRP